MTSARGAWPANEAQHPIDTYKELIQGAGIPLGDVGTHVPTIIHFTSCDILEKIGGYPFFGPSYRAAVGAEVGVSRLIEARGYRVCQLKGHQFAYIGHQQWTAASWQQILKNNAKKAIKNFRPRRSE